MFARATLNFGTAENVVVPDLAIVKPVSYTHLDVYKRQVELFKHIAV